MPGYSGEFICIILISCIPCDGCIYIDGVCPEDEGRKEWYSFSFVNYSVSIIQLELASASLFLQVRASKTDCLQVRLRPSRQQTASVLFETDAFRPYTLFNLGVDTTISTAFGDWMPKRTVMNLWYRIVLLVRTHTSLK